MLGGTTVVAGPAPKACASLSDSDYLDACMNGIAQSDKAGQDELQRQLDEAVSQDAGQPANVTLRAGRTSSS